MIGSASGNSPAALIRVDPIASTSAASIGGRGTP
jgi:hypothetical protein